MADVTVSVGADYSEAHKAGEKFASDFTKNIESELSSIGDIVKGAFTFDAIGGAGDFLSGFAESGVAFRDSLKSLQVQTGATGKEFETLKASAEDAFLKGVGESVDEAVKSIATAQKALGKILPQDQIAQFTADAAQLGKVYDKDVNEVIGKSRTFLQNFNLDGQKGAELISLALRDSGNAMDDTLDTLDEYSQLWKETGLSAEGAVQLITSGVQAGARDTDKIADSLKELQIRLKADDTGNALKDISAPVARQIEQLKTAAQSGQLTVSEFAQQSAAKIEEAFKAGTIGETMRSQLQVAIAGTPAEDLGADLYAKIFSAPIDTAGIQKNAKEALEGVRTAAGDVSIFEKVGRSFELITTKVSEFAGPVIAGLGDVLGVVGQIGPALLAVVPLLPTLAGGFAAVWAAVTGPVGIVVAAIAAVVAGFVLLYNNVQPFANFIDGIVSAVSQIFDTVAPAFTAFADVLIEIGSVVLDMIIAPFEIAWDVITALGEAIFGTTGPSVDMSDILKVLGGIVGKLVSAFKGMQEGIKKVGDTIQGAKAAFLSFIDSAIGAVGNLLSLDIDGFIDKIANAGDRAAEAQQRAITAAASERRLSEINSTFQKGTLEIVEGVKKGTVEVDAAIKSLRDSLALPSIEKEHGEFLREKLAELEGMKKEAQTATNKNPVTIPTKVTPPKPAEVVSFLADVQKLLEESTALEAKISITAATDSTERLRLEFAERQRLIERDIENERAALQKKYDDAIAAKKKLSDAEFATLSAAQDALATKERALRLILHNEQITAIQELAQKRVEEENRVSLEGSNRAIALLKAQQAAITGETVEAIRARGELAREELEVQQFLELEQLLQGLEATRRAIGEAGILSGIYTREEVEADLRQFRASLLANNKLVLAIQTRQKNDRATLATQTTEAEQKALQDGSLAYQAQFALRSQFAKAFFDTYDKERQESLQKEIDDLRGDGGDLWQDYLDGRIDTYQDFAEKLDKINTDISQKQAELAGDNLSFWDKTAKAAEAAFNALGEVQRAALDKNLTTLNASIETQLSTVQKSGNIDDFDFDAIQSKLVDTAKIAATEIGAVWAAMAASGRATLGDFADAALITTLKSIRTLVEGNIVGIISAAFAINPLVGALSIPAVIAVEVLLSKWEADARARLGNNGFRHGGYTGDGPTWGVAGDAHFGEFYFSREKTVAWRPFFDMIQANKIRPGDLATGFPNGPVGVSQHDMQDMILRSERRTAHAYNSGMVALRQEFQQLRGELVKTAKEPTPVNLEHHSTYQVRGQSRISGGDMVTVYDGYKKGDSKRGG